MGDDAGRSSRAGGPPAGRGDDDPAPETGVDVVVPDGGDLRRLADMAGAVGHDFGNLMTVFMTLADLIEQAAGPDTATDELRELRHAAERGTRLVRRLLDFAQPGAAGVGRVDLPALIDDLIADLRARLPSLLLDVDTRAVPPETGVDASAVAVTVVGLVTNAAEASRPGATVSLTADLVEAGPGRRPTRDAGHVHRRLRLRIRDRGQGMTPDVAARAFDPLFTTKRDSLGAGLGLPTAHGAVQRAGGTLHLESAPGRGTLATVLLPAAVPRSDTPPGPLPGSPCILVVDDDEQVRHSVAGVLRSRGATVETAADVRGALRCIDAGVRVDAVLCDLRLPVEPGADLPGELRRRDVGTPVGFMSGDPSLEAAAGPLLVKPFTGAELLRFIDSLVGADA